MNFCDVLEGPSFISRTVSSQCRRRPDSSARAWGSAGANGTNFSSLRRPVVLSGLPVVSSFGQSGAALF